MSQRFGTYAQIEEGIEIAIAELDSGLHTDIRAAADCNHVPYSRLQKRVSGRASKMERAAPNRRLNQQQEATLKAYITRCDALYMPPLMLQLISAAQRILDLEHPDGKAPPIGKNWISRWLARNPDCRRKKQKKQEIKRPAANTVEVYERHFGAPKRAIDEYAIQPGDLYNIDETGIHIGVGGQRYIITMASDDDDIQSPSDKNRESVTVVETVAADGSVLALFIILKDKVHLSKWYTRTKLPDNYTVGVSETAYNNDELSVEWIKHFDACSHRRQTGTWRLLVFDGFGSHGRKELIDFCDDNDVVLFSPPSHTSHNLQSLDVVVFQAY